MPLTDEQIQDQIAQTDEAVKEFQESDWYSRKIRRDSVAHRKSLLRQASLTPNPSEPRRCRNLICKLPLKTAGEFYNDRRSKDGLDRYCKDCRSLLAKNYRKKTPGYATAYSSKRRQTEAYVRQLLAHILVMDPSQHYRIPVPPPHLCINVNKWIMRIKKSTEHTRMEAL